MKSFFYVSIKSDRIFGPFGNSSAHNKIHSKQKHYQINP